MHKAPKSSEKPPLLGKVNRIESRDVQFKGSVNVEFDTGDSLLKAITVKPFPTLFLHSGS
jgi:hypothetical protein